MGSEGNNPYVVLARKWRPAQFSDIVSQGHVVRTLMNAVAAGRIHQAYLFTGSRGIGKTSIARIFAKVLRCGATSQEAGPDGQTWLRSCDECSSCREIASGNGVDVIEIDGASNNGVEAVREIRENAKFMPSTGSRKIYIIDEVHMLTTAAFNALLKTLEEPPAHVIFVLATTEPHKIPTTILSRCQRFDFRRASAAQLQALLARVAKAEGVEAEPAALALIARAAEGGMRDALSLLDQVISYSSGRVTAQAARDSIGLIESQTLLGALAAVLGRKPVEALALVDQAYQRGHDLRVLTRNLIELLHGAVLAKVGAPREAALELTPITSDEEWAELQTAAALRPLEELEMIFQVLHHGMDWVARSPQPKIVLDLLLVKCAAAEALVFAENTAAAPKAPTPAIPQTQPVAAPVTSAPKQQAAPVLPQPAKSWEGWIEHVRGSRPLLASILEHGVCAAVPGPGEGPVPLTIRFRPEEAYYREQLQSRIYHEQLQTLAREYFGRVALIQVELAAAGASLADGESVAARRDREEKSRDEAAREAALNHPIIREARSLFGGELGPIETAKPGEGPHAGA